MLYTIHTNNQMIVDFYLIWGVYLLCMHIILNQKLDKVKKNKEFYKK